MLSMRTIKKAVGSLAVGSLVIVGMVVSSAPSQAAPVMVHDGLSAATAAASCWDIKANYPASADGTYWLLTPAMSAPAQFYCDQTTDGGGWVLVGKGREGWKVNNNGTGQPSALQIAGLSPMSGATTQYSATVVENLLNGGRPDALPDGIRLKRATTADGTQWQEARFNTDKMDRWVWTFSAEHVVSWYSFNGVKGAGGQTASFGADNGYNRVNTNTLTDATQKYTQGFAYGTAVTGTSDATSYLWSATTGGGSARPYTEMYLRPQISSLDPGFARISDTGTSTKTNVPVASSTALDSPWGVAGPVKPKREGDVEVQAFVQSGSTMYVGGNFTSVQRSASATGVDKVSQAFLAAFDVNSGELIQSFAPKLDGSVMTLAVLPNGYIVAGGMFGNANGAPSPGLVAVDPLTGATASNWKVTIENRITGGVIRVSDLVVSGPWLYLGGSFTHLTSAAQPTSTVYARNAARVAIGDGTPDANWNPDFDGTVVAVDTAADGGRFYAAGYFGMSGTIPVLRAAAVQSAAGAPLATPAWTPTWSSTNNYQQAIASIGSRVWVGGSEHSLFSYSPTTFDRLSGNIGKNHGDFQTIAPSKTGMLYAGSHGHDFVYSNAFTWPSIGTAWTEADSFDWIGAWDSTTGSVVPTFTPSMTMRLNQGIWASQVDSNGTLWVGGDIVTAATKTAVNKWAGGMARFAQTDATAPSQPGNISQSQDTATTVKLSWGAATDNSGSVSYQILRNDRVIATTTGRSLTVPKGGENRYFVRAVDAAGNLSTSTPVSTAPGGNASPIAAFSVAVSGLTAALDGSTSTDDGSIVDYSWNFGDGSVGTGVQASHVYAAPGTYTVALTVTDNGGEKGYLTHSVDIVQPAPADAYGAGVYADSPTLYYRLGESSGTTAADASTNLSPGTYSGGVTLGASGALAGVNNTAATFDGTSGLVASQRSYTNPTTYSLETWFKTTTTSGGKLIGFGDKATGLSGNYDRHIYMQNNGALVFGTYTGSTNVITSPNSYNDGKWHTVVATQSSAGMVLYVDGVQVGTNPQTAAQNYTGYWRIGGDNTWGSSSPYFAGTIDEAAVYPAALTASQVAHHYHLGGGNVAPTAQFTSTVNDRVVTLDASASTDDGTITAYAWNFGDGTTGTGAQITHTYVGAGTYPITLTITDDGGLTGTQTQNVAITRSAPTDAYGAAVYGDAPSQYFRLGDSSGTTATDSSPAGSPGIYSGGVTLGAPGVIPGVSDTAANFDGNSGLAATQNPVSNPTTYSLEIWFKTTTTRGGKLIGFGDKNSGTSSSYDRHVYMQDDGRLVFGTWTGSMNTITSANPYNDGTWHAVVATQSSAGMVMYVDGVQVGTNPQTAAQDYTGYWRIGGDSTWGSTSAYFAGTLDEAAVYPTALTDVQVAHHYQLGSTVAPVNVPPVASFTSAVTNLSVAVDGGASTDADGTVASYAWDFGDGATGTGVTAQHAYSAAGTYTVTLTVTDNQGATGTKTASVTVTASVATDVTVLAAKSVWSWRFEPTAPPTAWKNPGFDASAWKSGSGVFGFGSTGLGTNIDVTTGNSTRPLAAYFVRTFTVDNAALVSKLVLKTVADDGVVVYVNGVEVGRSGMPAGAVTFNTYASAAVRTSVANANPVTIGVPLGLLVSGANTVAVETHLNYRSTPDVSFDLSAVATVGGTRPPNQAPVAKFTSLVTGLGVAVDATTSTDTDGSIASYAWNFGDGSTGTGATATHSYAVAGTYTVTLTVTDNGGATGATAAPVTVAVPVGPQSVVLIPAKSTWSYRFDATAPPTAWKNNGFDASTWKVGAGVLGWGSTTITTNIDVSTGASTRPLAAYFVSQFNVTSAAAVTALTLKTVADDGAVYYVNGTEVGRVNMPTGTITFNTYASKAVSTANANLAPVTLSVPTSLLVDGINTVAVETHLNYHSTPDLSFDMTATATVN